MLLELTVQALAGKQLYQWQNRLHHWVLLQGELPALLACFLSKHLIPLTISKYIREGGVAASKVACKPL